MIYPLLLVLFFSTLSAVDSWIRNPTVQEIKQLLKIPSGQNCTARHRTAFTQWLKRQAGEPRSVEKKEIEPLLNALGFSTLPARATEVDKQVATMLRDSLFCDQIYNGQQAQEIVRGLARDLFMAAEILKGAINNQKVTVPPLPADSPIFAPLSMLGSVLVNYIVNNAPDISTPDLNKVGNLLNQLIATADKQEPLAKDSRTQAAAEFAHYNKQVAPLLYNNNYVKGNKIGVPTAKAYNHARHMLSQNERFLLPKTIQGQIEGWRARAADFLKSGDYEPKRYKDPEVQYIVMAMVQDINSAAAIIKAYLEREPTDAILRDPSLVDPAVHALVKEIIKGIPTAAPMQNEKAASKAALQEVEAKILKLPPQYQDDLRQYINIPARMTTLEEQPVAAAPAPTPPPTAVVPPVAVPAQGLPVPTPGATPAEVPVVPPVVAVTPEVAAVAPTPTPEVTPAPAPIPVAEAPVPTPTAEAGPAPAPQAPGGAPVTEAPSGAPAGGGPAVLTQSPETPSDLKAALEAAGKVTEIPVGKAPTPTTPAAGGPAAPAGPSAAAAPAGGITQPTVFGAGVPSITPAVTPSVGAAVTPTTPVSTTPVAPTTPEATAPTTPAAPEATAPTTPTTPSTPAAPTTPTTPAAPTGPSVQDSLRDLQNQLNAISTQ